MDCSSHIGEAEPKPVLAMRLIRVLIVDDHPMLRDGLITLLSPQTDMSVVGEATSGEEALAAFRSLTPDVALMDVQMPGVDGIETARQIRREFPAARILMLATYGGDVTVKKALSAGCAGYLLKTSLRKELLQAIRVADSGGTYLSADIANELAAAPSGKAVTERETSILLLVAEGKANKEIARILKISEETIKVHLKNVFLKLEVNDRTLAVTVAIKRGIIPI